MEAEITFKTDHQDMKTSGAPEAVRILREIMSELMRGEESGIIYDPEGEIIGQWRIPLPM